MRIWLASVVLAAAGLGSCSAQVVAPAGNSTASQAGNSQEAATEPALLAVSEAMWRALQQHDRASLLRVTTPDLLFVLRPGVSSTDDLPASGCVVDGYQISEPKVRQVTALSATLVYRVHQDLRCKGAAEAADQFATDNFVKSEGQWRVAVHTQTPAAVSSPLPPA